MNKEILRFIKRFKKINPLVLKDQFYNGYCYYFAVILRERFGGEIFFNPNLIHFATLIDNKMYDINGVIKEEDNWFEWKTYSETFDTTDILNSCILKK